MKRIRILYLLLVLAMLLTLLLTACGGGSSSSSGSVSNAGSNSNGANTAPVEVIELRVHHHDHEGAIIDTWLNKWSQDVFEKSGGRLKLVIYPGAILGDQKQVYEMTLNGTCDIAWGSASAAAGSFPMTEIIQLPMLGFSGVVQSTDILMDMWEQTEYLKNDYREFQLLLLHTTAEASIYFKNETKLDSLADLKGKTLRTSGTWMTKYCQALGAAPITVGASEVYSAFEKGMMDGAISDWVFIQNWQIYELCKSYYDVRCTVNPDFIIMNQGVFDKLAPDLKEILIATTGRAGAETIAADYDNARNEVEKLMEPRGGKIIEPSKTLLEEMTAVTSAVWQEWVGVNANNGDAQGCLDWLLARIAALNK